MKKRNLNTIKNLTLSLSLFCFFANVSVQAQTNSAQPASAVSPASNKDGANAKPLTDAERQAQAEKMKADRELNLKIGQLNKEIQEAEKVGKADTPEIVAKKAELKKLQDQRNASIKADRDRIMKERAANPPAGQQEMIKINQLNKEIQEAEKAGKADAPEIVAKKAELKKLQDERNAKMKAERERMMKDRPMPTPEEMEANKKMGELNKEIKEAEKAGKGDTPEIVAKKAELKKLQEARLAKIKAERDKKMKEQNAAPVQNKIEAEPVKESK
jgi:hypothetical protein